jgi:uncharacterized protein (DUF433 family)
MLKVKRRAAPFEVDERGIARVPGTRFPIEGILLNWLQGESPESIARSFYPLDLEKVYAVVSYYLAHKEELHEYLRERDRADDELISGMVAAGVMVVHTGEPLQDRGADLPR